MFDIPIKASPINCALAFSKNKSENKNQNREKLKCN